MEETAIWLILPLIIPLLTAIFLLLALTSGQRLKPFQQRQISTAGSFLLMLSTFVLMVVVWRDGIQVVQVGSWPMPFGITLVADTFSAIMLVLAGLVGFSVQLYANVSIDPEREALGFYSLYHALLLGVCGAFLTGDLFNLFVWFEVMLMASFVLIALGSRRGQTEGAIKYVTLNLISSAIFLSSIGITYGVVGTLNMADLSVKFAEINQTSDAYSGLINVLAVMFLIAFGIKAAVFPLFFWLPDSYHAPPPAVSAVFAGLLTKVGVYSIIRVFTLVFPLDESVIRPLLIWIAGFTMVTGVLGTVAQYEVRRILSFHIISQIGYMVMGLALFTPLALGGAVYFILHNMLVKTNLFLVGGLIERMGGTGDLKKLGGLYRSAPLLAILFLLPALSLGGIPPLSGFFAKLSLIIAGIEVGQYGLVAASLVTGFWTLYSMTKIWTLAFWQEPEKKAKGTPGAAEAKTSPELHAQTAEGLAIRQGLPPDEGTIKETNVLTPDKILFWKHWLAPMVILTVVALFVGIGAGIVFPVTMRAGQELIDTSGYITAVFRSGQ
jgi:multicomponent Na+:H+ antiporter subunit D